MTLGCQLGEPPVTSIPGTPACNPHLDPPVLGDCWYNCTLDDISGEDKKHRLHKVVCVLLSLVSGKFLCDPLFL